MNTKLCPYCSAEIEKTALRCRYCRADLFDFKIYMSSRQWIAEGGAIAFIGYIIVRVSLWYSVEQNLSGTAAFWLITTALIVYVIAIVLVAYFYHYSQFQTELNKKIQENIKLKRTDKYSARHPVREKSDTVSAKEPKSFTTTSAFKDEKYDKQNKKRISDDLKDKGFKVITKVKD